VDTVPGAAQLDFRAIHARSIEVAHVAATAGRIWRTTDGGRTWSMRYQATDTSMFLDGIDFWDDRNGVALGDPSGGRFVLLVTTDGGESWKEAPVEERPAAADGEAAFAASGSVLIASGSADLWIGSGGLQARLHHSPDRGRTWHTVKAPHPTGRSAGTFALAVGPEAVFTVGGDYALPDSTHMIAGWYPLTNGHPGAAASSARGPRGFRSGVAAARAGAAWTLISVGTNGSDISRDGGRSWEPFDRVGFHAVRASADGTFFASGGDGRVAVFHLSTRP
jgi:photosystem II stability/assembly factor-like uncharacterized protein